MTTHPPTGDLALFPEVEAYDDDPINPSMERPTPPSIIAGLTRPERVQRVNNLIIQAQEIFKLGIETHRGDKTIKAVAILFSGGNDSTTLAHLFRFHATHAVHANTTIGAEETRQYVRDTCEAWGLPLVEKKPPYTFREIVLGLVKTRKGEDVWPGGFPGPGAHSFIYQRIKERALDAARYDLGIGNSKTHLGVFVAGRRRLESEKRADIPLHEIDGSVVWVSPIANWSKLDLNTYRLMHEGTDDPVPRNWVADLMHMSMECLCGAYAHRGELDEIRLHFPHIAAEIDALAAEVRAAIAAGELDIDPAYATWGHGLGKPSGAGRMCSSCDARFATLFTEGISA